jgi:hypothetical protein
MRSFAEQNKQTNGLVRCFFTADSTTPRGLAKHIEIGSDLSGSAGGLTPKEAGAMAVLMTMDIGIGRADLEAVSAEMGVADNPPNGLIAHVLTEAGNGVHVVDIWESQEAFQKFNDEQLMGAMQKVLTERGVSMDGPLPEPSFSEAFDVVRGR